MTVANGDIRHQASILIKDGVKFGTGYYGGDDGLRQLPYEASWVKEYAEYGGSKISFEQMLGWITWEIADILKIKDAGKIEIGKKAVIALFDDNPFQYGQELVRVVGNELVCPFHF